MILNGQSYQKLQVGMRGFPASLMASFLSALAGFSHFSLAVEHADTLILTLFLSLVGIMQLGLAALFILYENKWLYRIGVISSGGLILLYAITRFVEVPIGHHAEPGPIDPFGILVKLAEAGTIVALLYLLRFPKILVAKPGWRLARAVNGKGELGHNMRAVGTSKGKLLLVVAISFALVASYFAGVWVGSQGLVSIPKAPISLAQKTIQYTLILEPKQIKIGDKSWEVWTYNGTVPGPTLRGQVGDILSVKLINKHNLTHSIHTHLRGYKFEMDGSQANIIAGKGASSMVPPNGEYTYVFPLTTAGIYYYHCHSADGDRPIAFHIRMGLYGAIIVDEPDLHPARDFVLFYAEGQPRSPAPYVLNNRGIPGGEHALERLFKEKGFQGVAAQLNVTVTAFKVKQGDTVRLHVINIGDMFHSHHHHGFEHRSIRTLRGDAWAAAVLPLMPGQADTLEFRAIEPGLWLIHCHVVSHADAGMIAVLIVE